MSFVVVLWGALTLAANPPGEAPKDMNERLKGIITAMESRAIKREPVSIKYRLVEYYSADMLWKTTPKSPGNRPKPKTLNVTRSYHVALKGAKFFLTSAGPFNVSPIAAKKEQPSVWIFDGKTTYEKLDDKFAVSSQQPKGRPMLPWDVTGETTCLAGLKELNDSLLEENVNTPRLSIFDEKTATGEPHVRLEVVCPGVSKTVIWLRPDLDYAVHKAERYKVSGKVSLRFDQCTYEVIDGKAYPRSAVKTVFRDGTDAVVLRIGLTVDSIETDSGQIPDSLFHLDIPKNQPLFDRDKPNNDRRSECDRETFGSHCTRHPRASVKAFVADRRHALSYARRAPWRRTAPIWKKTPAEIGLEMLGLHQSGGARATATNC